jgi:ferredoxin-thioredoxin reductase catalytic subunit
MSEINREDVESYYRKLQKLMEPKGMYFNSDHETVMDLLESLLINMKRYGYASCPCRLASGNYEADKDIICPCVYAWPDVEEYGSCYCHLYVSKDWNEGRIPRVHVPERRPREKVEAALEHLV